MSDRQPRTEEEIVQQTEKLAKFLLSWRFGQVTDNPNYMMRHSPNPRVQECWAAACKIQEELTATDVENAVAEVDDGQYDQSRDVENAGEMVEASVNVTVNVKVRLPAGTDVEEFITEMDYTIVPGTDGVSVVETEVREFETMHTSTAAAPRMR